MTEEKAKAEVKKSKGDEASESKEDDELSALLDSALEDFKNPPKPSGNVESSQKPKEDPKPTPPNNLWDDEFLRSRLEQNLQSFLSPGADGTFSAEQLGENIQRFAEAATHAVEGETSPDTEFSNIIAQTLRNLTENTENLQNQFTDDDLMNMLGPFGNLADPGGDPGELLPFMQHMMQILLSKDILYPALMGTKEKYSQWLGDNKTKLSSSDFERYSEQHRIMIEVCSELEKESSSDSTETKNSRFDKILALMQKMQDCGQPPPELAGDLSPMLNLDEHGNPQLPPNFSSNQCSLM